MSPWDQNASIRSSVLGRGGRRSAAVLLLATGGLLATWGCGDDPPRFRIRVDTNAEVPEQINKVKVWVTASRGPVEAPALCRPSCRSFEIRQPSDLPFYVDFLPGPKYRRWVYLRVEYFRFDVRVGFHESPALQVPESGTFEAPLELDAACLEHACADPLTPQCIDGECALVTGAFDDPGHIDDGAPSCQTLVEADSGC